MLLARQVWTLVVKNLRILLLRRWITTPLTALIFPVLFTVFLCYAKNLFFTPGELGIGEPRNVRSLSDAARDTSGDRDRFVFVNAAGLEGGDIEQVLDSVSVALGSANIRTVLLESEDDLLAECRSSSSGSSRCLSAAVFHSSPDSKEGSSWNYTIRADGSLGSTPNVRSNANDAQIYTLPFQHAIDFAIAEAENRSSTENFPTSRAVLEYPFTQETNKQQSRKISEEYMARIEAVLSLVFFLALVGVLYQLSGLIATERETGITQLLDSMMPNHARWQPQAARLLSHKIAFAILYAPGWIAMGAIAGGMAFQNTSILVPLVSYIVCGLSLTSLAIFFGCCFQKAQLSGFVAVIVSLILAVGAQVSGDVATGWVVFLSLIFPPMNFVFLMVLMARWEGVSQAASVTGSFPESNSTVPVIAFWILAIVHAIVYLVLAAVVESWLWGTATSSRQTGEADAPVAVRLRGFSKIYNPTWTDRMLSWISRKVKPEPFQAVDNLNLDVYRGEVMVLLGPNGGGKSTTLDNVAGLQSPSSGAINVSYGSGGGRFGYCPQKNVLWEELSVTEHVNIFDNVKSTTGKPSSKDDRHTLIESCDLTKKAGALAGTLSGGQKRKLQLALMFAGDSTVCCVDEVSSGVDPLSRRKLWDILLHDVGRRTILLTTHYLDEADFLANRVAILCKGKLKTSGTPAELKENLGRGYQVRVNHSLSELRSIGVHSPSYHYPAEENNQHTKFMTGDSEATLQFLKSIEARGVFQYTVSGTTLEDVFLEYAADDTTSVGHVPAANAPNSSPSAKGSSSLGLWGARRTGLLTQLRVLFLKRWKLLLRDPSPYLVAIAIPVIAAGCCTIFLSGMKIASCGFDLSEPATDAGADVEVGDIRLLAGPGSLLSKSSIADILGSTSASITLVDDIKEFNEQVQDQVSNLTGGFFIADGSKPTFTWRADEKPGSGHMIQNLLDNVLLNTTINSAYEPLMVPFQGDTGDIIIISTIFVLAMAIYPSFLGLYPVYEKLKGVRGAHYSNGVRPLPLWLSYLLFDFSTILLVSTVVTITFAATTNVWYHLEYLFVVMLLFGIAATLFSYVISLFAVSQLGAFGLSATVQAISYLVFFIANMATSNSADPSGLTSILNTIFFAMGYTSPTFNLTRALYLSVNLFGIACSGNSMASYPGAIDLYGGPILYLTLQILVLLGIVLWHDDAFKVPQFATKAKCRYSVDEEMVEMATDDASSSYLQVEHLKKKFGKFEAVQDVSFSIPKSSCLALLGPNGAGKTTCISMIQGELAPTGNETDILVDGTSVIHNRELARTKLGVCPQIDPLDNMTVREHLQFYAEIRGIHDPAHNVGMLLQSLGLLEYSDRMALKLSGGNKRKLSLCIALMGNPKVLLLDEPSSGMDALSQRLMWRTISSLTPDRSVLLTTHSMEEANALASHVGIVAGRMLAEGTSDELKDRFGVGYVAHLIHEDAPHTSLDDMIAIRAWIERSFPNSSMTDRAHNGQVRFEFSVDGSNGTLADAMENLEVARRQLRLSNASVTRTTLDRVFFTVVGEWEDNRADPN